MTRDELIESALQCGVWIPMEQGRSREQTIDRLQRFVGRAVAAEREACAKVCEEIEDEYRERESLKYAELKTDAQTGASDCAYRIRARGDIKISPQC